MASFCQVWQADHCRGAEHQQATQGFIVRTADGVEPLCAADRGSRGTSPRNAARWHPDSMRAESMRKLTVCTPI